MSARDMSLKIGFIGFGEVGGILSRALREQGIARVGAWDILLKDPSQETFPGLDWEKQGAYFFSRVVQHGKRRAEEMREAALTVGEAGFEPVIAAATAEKQDWVARLGAAGTFAGVGAQADWREYADRLIDSPRKREKTACRDAVWAQVVPGTIGQGL
jgi:hypothetical protein